MIEGAITIGCPGDCCSELVLSNDVVDALTDPAQNVHDGARTLDLMKYVGPSPLGPGNSAFKCLAFDEVTRRCSEYEARPSICSRYPYGNDCQYCTAGYSEPPKRWPPVADTGIFVHDYAP